MKVDDSRLHECAQASFRLFYLRLTHLVARFQTQFNASNKLSPFNNFRFNIDRTFCTGGCIASRSVATSSIVSDPSHASSDCSILFLVFQKKEQREASSTKREGDENYLVESWTLFRGLPVFSSEYSFTSCFRN